MSASDSAIQKWQRVSDHELVDCRIFTVNESNAKSPITGKEHSFFFINSGDWVNIVPITSAGEVVFIRQFRHGSEEITLEIPGGMVDQGEQPQVAAVRECLEESGFKAGTVESLGALNPNPAIFGNKLHTFVARDCVKVGEIANTSTEHTEVELIPMEQLPAMMSDGRIDHALVVATLWRLLYQEQQQDR